MYNTQDLAGIVGRLPSCRNGRAREVDKANAKKGGSMGYQGGGFGGGPREMHKAICAECKKECEVPFKPREDRPVYCKECFSKRKEGGR